MSATTSDRRAKGFVAETLRRPIQDAVREGVAEALQEQKVSTRERGGGSESSGGGGGRSWGRLALLGLIGLGAAYFVMRRRRGDSGGDRTTSQIRQQSKTSTTPAQPDVGGEESVETMEESLERSEGNTEGEEDATQGAAPGASSEDD